MQTIRNIIGIAAVSSVIGLGGCAIKDVSEYNFKASGQPTMEIERARAVCDGMATRMAGIHGHVARQHKSFFLACMAEKGFVEVE